MDCWVDNLVGCMARGMRAWLCFVMEWENGIALVVSARASG